MKGRAQAGQQLSALPRPGLGTLPWCGPSAAEAIENPHRAGKQTDRHQCLPDPPGKQPAWDGRINPTDGGRVRSGAGQRAFGEIAEPRSWSGESSPPQESLISLSKRIPNLATGRRPDRGATLVLQRVCA